MPAISKPGRRAIATIGAITKHHGPDDQRLPELRRDLRAAELAEHVRKIVDTFPPLTEEQRSKICALLRAEGHGGAAT